MRMPEARDRIEAAAQNEKANSDSPPFEKMVAELNGDQSFVARTVHRILAFSFLEETGTFAEGKDRYDELVQRLQLETRETIIITLNYDILLEEALARNDVQFSVPVFKESESSVTLFKPHGSVNWTTSKPLGIAASYETAAAQTPPLTFVEAGPFLGVQSGSTRVHKRHDAYSILLKRVNLAPVIGMYTHGKHVLDNSHHLAAHRQSCLNALGALSEADVTAIGVRRPTIEDDQVLSQILDQLSALKGSKVYVSPNASDGKDFEEMGFLHAALPMAEWLNTLGA